ncbi:SRPBCC family protein [Jiulongibacter sediminis]|jgi:uncharacterized protein YndB with AHSA1/START domain|uniref:SRPBCC family protein n=1 Tax=Jiulongibacter sediminis TaxID=1605367 RepID=UPI0026F2B853|nr:SRPBCC family protein [Jiulongibacter sediminis]
MRINEKAPVVQRREIKIQASPEKVWEVLTNIEKWPDWNNKISKSSVESRIKKGTVFNWKTGGSMIKSKIHTFQPYHLFGWTGKAFGASAIHNWNLYPTEEFTIVSVEESMEGWVIRLFKTQMNKKLGNDMGFWLKRLKLRVEECNLLN